MNIAPPSCARFASNDESDILASQSYRYMAPPPNLLSPVSSCLFALNLLSDTVMFLPPLTYNAPPL